MSRLTDKIAEAARRQSMVETYAPIVSAAGYLDGSVVLTPEDCYFLAGAIMRDAEVSFLGRTRFATQRGTRCVYDVDYVAAIESLGDEGRAALRGRVKFTPTRTRGVPVQ